MSERNLDSFEERILLAIGFANGFSKGAHNSEEIIKRHYDTELKKSVISGNKYVMKKVRKAWDALASLKYIKEHPTEGAMTYELTEKGFRKVLQLKDEAGSGYEVDES